MKNSPLTSILLVLLAISAVLSLVFFWRYVNKTRELRVLQFQVTQINQKSAAMSQLVGDIVEYSKRYPNHDIERLLESVGVTNKPAAK